MEIYKRFRPKDFSEMIGQAAAVKLLTNMVKKKEVPHALLLTGYSGCGKTTAARILRGKLDCSEHDFFEINAADSRGIDTVRDIRERMQYHAIGGTTRIFLIDEAHKLTTDAQNALLKMLEDTPKHVYFILASTDPQKVLLTVRTRCTEVKFAAIDADSMLVLLGSMLKQAKLPKLSKDVIDRIVEVADGSARKALVLLEQAAQLDTEEEQLEIVLKADARAETIALCRVLMNPTSKFKDASKIAKAIQDEPETIRRIVLGYFAKVLLDRPDQRIARILNAFSSHWFDSGKAGLSLALYDVYYT